MIVWAALNLYCRLTLISSIILYNTVYAYMKNVDDYQHLVNFEQKLFYCQMIQAKQRFVV